MVYTLRVYVGIYVEGVLIDAFSRIIVQKRSLNWKMSLLFEEIWISPKLEVCGAREVDIRNQRPRLRRNRLILVEKAGGVCKGVPNFLIYKNSNG